MTTDTMNPPAAKQFVRQLEDGQRIDTVFLVKESSLRSRKSGDDFLKMTLADNTGTVAAILWDDAARTMEVAAPGQPVKVRGAYRVDPKFGATITVRQLEAPGLGDFEESDLVELPAQSYAEMEADFRNLIATVRNPNLAALLDRLFDPATETWRLFKDAPAAKFYHQAYRHGLLEHTLSVAQGVSAAAGCFPGIDRDLAVTGALVHDIGKLDTYEFAGEAIELTDPGRLHGEIPMGFYRVRRTLEELPDFPRELAKCVLHIILSHHGSLEHGSPVVPSTREATLVHMIDNLGGRLGSYDRVEKNLRPGANWSDWDRALEGPAYFSAIGPA